MFTFDDNLYSDLYKDVYGFRPRGCADAWNKMSDEEKQVEWDHLCKQLEYVMAEEKLREQEAIKSFEGRIVACISVGAKDRKEAIGWIVDSSIFPRQI